MTMCAFLNRYMLCSIIIAFTLVVTAILSGMLWLMFVPVVLFVVASAVIRPTFYALLMIVAVAFSVPLSYFYPGIDYDIFLVSEVLTILLLGLLALNQLNRRFIDKQFIKHPITISIAAYLGWMLLTSLTSTMVFVSLKHFIVNVWFIAAFYYFAYFLFKHNPDFITKYVLIFSVVTLPVVVYALTRQFYFFAGVNNIAHWAASPFYKDHTSYGAVLAMYLPFLLLFALGKDMKRRYKVIFFLVALLFIGGIVFSYTRAAWISLVGALAVYIIFRLRLKLRIVVMFISAVILAMALLSNMKELMFHIERNKQESSGDLLEHIKSISNISNDASNLERINRWVSAFNMFKDKPLLGFGPGTYSFKYAPYQQHKYKTVISTNSGDFGNAHSEYLGILSESGLPGLISLLSIIVITTVRVTTLYHRQLDDQKHKRWLLGAYLGLVTYFIHGGLNNFLDTDKISLPFWSFLAIILFIDISYANTKRVNPETQVLKE